MAFTVCLTACSTDDGTYTDPITLYEKVSGEWTLSRLKQTDEIAKANGGRVTEMDLSGQFGFDTFGIQLATDSQNRPTTFTVTGSAPALIPVSGYWDLSSDFQSWTGTPVELRFYSDAARTTRTGSVSVTSVPGTAASLELTLTRKSNGQAFVSYSYTLIPANN